MALLDSELIRITVKAGRPSRINNVIVLWRRVSPFGNELQLVGCCDLIFGVIGKVRMKEEQHRKSGFLAFGPMEWPDRRGIKNYPPSGTYCSRLAFLAPGAKKAGHNGGNSKAQGGDTMEAHD